MKLSIDDLESTIQLVKQFAPETSQWDNTIDGLQDLNCQIGQQQKYIQIVENVVKQLDVALTNTFLHEDFEMTSIERYKQLRKTNLENRSILLKTIQSLRVLL
tara:strand:- start:7430 stop:7738 length:309 start_codon:yes stop_codon:yes gene_type:complete